MVFVSKKYDNDNDHNKTKIKEQTHGAGSESGVERGREGETGRQTTDRTVRTNSARSEYIHTFSVFETDETQAGSQARGGGNGERTSERIHGSRGRGRREGG